MDFRLAVIPAKARLQGVRLHGCMAFGEISGSAELAEDRAVVERRLEQAAEDARSRPAQARLQGCRRGFQLLLE